MPTKNENVSRSSSATGERRGAFSPAVPMPGRKRLVYTVTLLRPNRNYFHARRAAHLSQWKYNKNNRRPARRSLKRTATLHVQHQRTDSGDNLVAHPGGKDLDSENTDRLNERRLQSIARSRLSSGRVILAASSVALPGNFRARPIRHLKLGVLGIPKTTEVLLLAGQLQRRTSAIDGKSCTTILRSA